MREMELRGEREVQPPGNERQECQRRSHSETDQKKVFQSHNVLVLLGQESRLRSVAACAVVGVAVRPLLSKCGFRTCSKRSTRFGVSRIAPSNTMALRESS